jgi:DNA-binding response OmpR family regulator
MGRSIEKKTVMICDDEVDLIKRYSAALKKYFNVLTVDSGIGCIEKYMESILRGKKIDVLLLDYRLDDIWGDDVVRKVCELDGTKIILLSAFELEKDKIDQLKASNCIVDSMIKPAGLKTLFENVQGAISS